MHCSPAIDIHLFSCRSDTGPSILSTNPEAGTLAYSSAQCTLHCLPLVETHLKASQDWDYTSTSCVPLFCTAKLRCVIPSVSNRGCTIWVPRSDLINNCSSPGGAVAPWRSASRSLSTYHTMWTKKKLNCPSEYQWEKITRYLDAWQFPSRLCINLTLYTVVICRCLPSCVAVYKLVLQEKTAGS